MMKAKISWRIAKEGLVAILRGLEEDAALKTAQALMQGGVKVMEVTLNTKGALDAISLLAAELGEEMLIGAGTVLDSEGAFAAINAGAEFLVTPTVNPEVLKVANRYGKPVLAGAMTPTEALTAMEFGAEFVKVFPAVSLGPSYIRQLQGPLPQIPLVAVGGVTVDNAASFLQAGAVAVGVGSVLLDKAAIDRGDWDLITQKAEKFVEAVAQGRES